MISNTNISSDKSEAQLYEVLLYKKKDIIAIQEKLGINSNAHQMAVHQSKKAKTLDDSYELLFDLVEELRPILEELALLSYNNKEALMEISLVGMSFEEIYHLLLYLEEDISIIQEELGIVGYTNQEREKKPIKMQEHIFKSSIATSA